MPSLRGGGGIIARLLAISLFVALAQAAWIPGGGATDFSKLFRRQSSTIKNELRPQLSANAAIYEASDGTAFNDAKSRWSDYAMPGVSAVVVVKTENDIVKTIQYCNSKNRKWFVQNSGHGWSKLDMLQDLVIIKVDTMTSIVINSNKDAVAIGPGVNMGQLISALYAQQRQTTLGTCDCPGVIGAMLGGGHGRLQGLYGLIADNLLSARMVKHDGSIEVVTPSSNPDLFWALRGAGHNFGVISEATLRIHNVANAGLHYNVVTFYEEWQLEQIFGAMNNITLPERATAYVMFFSEASVQRQYIAIDFTYAGRLEDGEALLHSIFDVRLPQRSNRVVRQVTWGELNSLGMLGIAQLWCQRGARKNSHSTSMKFYNNQDVRTVWNGYKQIVQQNPEAHQSMFLWETYPMQGMRNRDPNSTAYSNRDVNHIVVAFLIYMNPALDGVMTAYGNNAFKNVLNTRSGFGSQPRVYVNYAQGNERPAEYYGWESWRQQKLANLKAIYDPSGRLNGWHAVPKVTGNPWLTV